jgi:methionine synthase II (cobalamin-independent)
VAFIGVINPLDPTVETAEHVADALVVASKYISSDQLGATDGEKASYIDTEPNSIRAITDCGFSPFSIDVKP